MGERAHLKELTNIETGLECETGECVCVHALDWRLEVSERESVCVCVCVCAKQVR